MLENENGGGMVMPVSPMYGGNGNGNGMFGDGAWWLIILFVLLFGNNGWGGQTGGNGGLYPWMNQANQVNDGFRDQMLNSNINGINGQLNGLQMQVCNGFGQAEIAANARQMADMNQIFGFQTAVSQGQTALQAQLAQCCCDNRLATEQLRATVAQENCADREALNYGVRDILNNQNAGIQRILDKLCDQELQAERRENQNLRSQLQMADLRASQVAQTAQILANNEAQTAALEQYLAPIPRPAYVVQNPNCCQQNFCGCSA